MKQIQGIPALLRTFIAMTLWTSSALCQERFNANPKGVYQPGEMFAGVKKAIHYPPGKNEEEKLRFPIKGTPHPAELEFTGSSDGPLRLAIRWPGYKQTALIDLASRVPEAFTAGMLKENWKIQATVYDIEDDGVPEVVVGINRWDGDYWDVSNGITALVFRFHSPKEKADMASSENWVFTGEAKGQTVILLDKDRILLPIGSSDANLFLLKNDRLIDAGGAWKSADGRYKPYQ
jgi:hypothetical protein